jgi:GxxExxY protein
MTGSNGYRINRQIPEEWNSLTSRIIGAAMEVHSILGPGMLEKMYEDALCVELQRAGIPFQRQQPIRMDYKGVPIGDLRLDVVVAELVVVELKAIDRALDVHGAQLLSYMRSASVPLGLLINFNVTKLTDGITRRLNPHCSLVRHLPLLSSALSALSASSEFLPGGSR